MLFSLYGVYIPLFKFRIRSRFFFYIIKVYTSFYTTFNSSGIYCEEIIKGSAKWVKLKQQPEMEEKHKLLYRRSVKNNIGNIS